MNLAELKDAWRALDEARPAAMRRFVTKYRELKDPASKFDEQAFEVAFEDFYVEMEPHYNRLKIIVF